MSVCVTRPVRDFGPPPLPRGRPWGRPRGRETAGGGPESHLRCRDCGGVAAIGPGAACNTACGRGVRLRWPVRDFGPPPLPRKGARGGGRPPGVVQRATCAVAIAGARPLSGPALPATRRENAVSVCVTRPVRGFAPPPLPAGARKP